MKIELYDAVYIITNIFFTLIIYKFQKIFFVERQDSVIAEIFSYVAYFAISTIVYLFFYIPVILMMSNIVMLFLLTFNYHTTMKKRILSVVLIYLSLLCIEMIVVLISGYIDFHLLKTSQYASVFGILLIRILTFVLVAVLSGFRNLKRGMDIPTEYWLNVLLLPISSIVILILLFEYGKFSMIPLLVCISLLLLINIGTFYLYDRMILMAENKTQMLLTLQQNEYFQMQIAMMKSSMEGVRVLRHDLKNQLCALQAIAQSGNIKAVNKHIDDLIGANESTKNYADSGNINIDSILNYKIFEAEQAGIPVTLQCNIPSSLYVASVDVCSILGNLIDNAIHACTRVQLGKRQINISIRYDKKCLMIVVVNTYDGKLIYKNGNIESSNVDKERHGVGLLSIRKSVEKYDGIMEIENTNELFKVVIILPL